MFLHPKIYKENKRKNIERYKFYCQFISKDDIVFDVGANFGNRIEPILKIRAKVIAFEPQSLCYEYLKLKFGRAILLEKKAIGEKKGELPLFLNDNASTISSLSAEWINNVKNGRFSNTSWSKFETVKIETLDELIKKYGLPQFIKIDVEGFELNVLNGLNHSPKYISIEYTIPECL